MKLEITEKADKLDYLGVGLFLFFTIILVDLSIILFALTGDWLNLLAVCGIIAVYIMFIKGITRVSDGNEQTKKIIKCESYKEIK